jgi:hypothetical protein
MAAIFTPVDGMDATLGTYRERVYDITFDAAYTTTGVALDPDSAGLVGRIEGFTEVGRATVSGAAVTAYPVASFDFKTQKLQLWGTAGSATGLTEIANATSLATVSIRAKVAGF